MKNMALIKIVLYGIPLPVLIISLFTGPSETATFRTITTYLLHFASGSSEYTTQDIPVIQTILFDVRLPRILLAFLVGGALAVSGSGLQAIFRNPLVSPYILGLSSGAAFGAAA